MRAPANARALEPVLGRFSLLTLDGDDHMRQRKLLLPPFHGEAVQRYRDLIAEIAAARSSAGRSPSRSSCGRACRRSRSR